MNVKSQDFYKGIGFYKRINKEHKNLRNGYSLMYNQNKHSEEENIKLKEQVERLTSENNKQFDEFNNYINKYSEDDRERSKKLEIYERYIRALKIQYGINDESNEEDEDLKLLKEEYFMSRSWNGFVSDLCCYRDRNYKCKGWDGKRNYCDCGKTKISWAFIKVEGEQKKYVMPITTINKDIFI